MRKPKKLQTTLQVLLGLASGAAIGVAVAMLTDDPAPDPQQTAIKERFGWWIVPFAILLAVVYGWLTIVIHELGHVAGGALARFRFHFMIAGPLRMDRDDRDRLRIGWNREWALLGGVASSLPTDTVDLRRRFFYMIAGGPFASLLLGLLVLVPVELIRVLGMMSAAVFLISLIPMRSMGFATDGARLLRLLSKGPAAVREAALLPLLGLASAGKPPREWPADLVGAAIGEADGTVDEYNGHLIAYYRCADLGDIAGARLHMERALELSETLPPVFKPALDVEAAYFKARYENDAAGARALLESVPAKALGVKGYEKDRARAGIAWAEGNFEEARRLAEVALQNASERDAFTKNELGRIVNRTA